MSDEHSPNAPQMDSKVEMQRVDAAFRRGAAAGCAGCVSASVLAVVGFACGLALVGTAHDYEWFYTLEEFRRNGPDPGMRAFGIAVLGGIVGAALFSAGGIVLFAWIRSSRKR